MASMRTPVVETLLTALREHDIPLAEDDVLWAFESAKTRDEATAWVREYINQPTLLTKEELELYRKIEKRGAARSAGLPLPSPSPFYDHEIETAIAALETSTAAIDRQHRELEIQKQALGSLIEQSKPSASSLRYEQDFRRRRAQEKGHLDFDINEMSHTLSEQLEAAHKDCRKTVNTFSAFASERLSSDNRKLTALSKIVPPADPSREKTSDSGAEQLCQALITFRTAEIKYRIDAVYRQGVAEHSELRGTNTSPTDFTTQELTAEKSALQSELDSLYSEISSVAEMVVRSELLSPLQTRQKARRANHRRTLLEIYEYISTTLEYLTLRIALSTQHAASLVAHRSALAQIDAVVRAIEPSDQVDSAPEPAHHRRQSSMKPTLSPPSPPSQTAMAFLRHLDIPSSSPSVSTLAQQSCLAPLEAHHRATTLNIHTTISQGLEEADKTTLALLNSVYRYSPYATIEVRDPELRARREKLAKSIGDISSQIMGLDELLGEAARGTKGEELVRRWGSERANN